MSEQGKQFIESVGRKWRNTLTLSGGLLAMGLTLLAGSLIYQMGDVSLFWFFLLFPAFLLMILAADKPWSISNQVVYRFLNDRFPQLEESSQLFLKAPESLNLLEKIQKSRIERKLSGLPKIKHRTLMGRIIFFLFSITGAAAIMIVPFERMDNSPGSAEAAEARPLPGRPEVLPAKIRSATISIRPPSYTRKAQRNQKEFSLLAEEGSLVTWILQTTAPVDELSFIFNDREVMRLYPVNQEKTLWKQQKKVNKPGFYQVNVNQELSELFQVQTIKDQPSSIRIITPKQYSTIDFGEPQRTSVRVSITDDYGIKSAVIIATTASGKGEGVKFSDQQLHFATDFKAVNRSYSLQKTLNLNGLGMVPGDELYFYVKALDNLNQESRSETYFVSIQDTAELMSMEGMASGVNLVPEYFRSMRQIIIDTERLIKDRSSISKEDFNSRSNSLGMDQKLLRLRYGKFLGEEGGEDDHEEQATDQPTAFGNTDAILNKFGHNHDNAEDATFFEPELKTQLKATLKEMWDSELRLRTYRPSEALPYEYKALRLLKDLQQKSRSYVAKTSSRTPALKKETRLSGELDKIINPFNSAAFPKTSDPTSFLRQAPQVINKLRNNEEPGSQDMHILAETNRILSGKAVANPSVYLGAVIALRKILFKDDVNHHAEDLIIIEKAIQRAIGSPAKMPQSGSSGTASGLSRLYFKNLNRLQR